MAEFSPKLKEALSLVQKPGRYTGGEPGCTYKDKANVDVRMAFCFPDTYEIGMSFLGEKILYELLNRHENWWCERAFMPWVDMKEQMERLHIPLYCLESKDPLTDFDIVGFSLEYELCYTNILAMLDLAGIPLLSGHIGGANDLARRLAAALGAAAVITTATDVNGKFAADAWAAKNGCAISSMPLAKKVAAEILEHDVPLVSDFPVKGALPGGIVEKTQGALGIVIGYCTKEPFAETLRLTPRVLRVGIGCRRGTAQETVEAAVAAVLSAHQLDPSAVKGVYSIDLKQQEAGLLAACAKHNWPTVFYTAEELRSVPGEFTDSPFVQEMTGVGNVCERAAMRGAEKLLVKKTAVDGVTVAVAAEHWEVSFG